MASECIDTQIIQTSIIEIAIEAWRFQRVFINAMSKLDAIESNKYLNQYKYFFRKVEAALENANIRIVNVEGQKYDIGLPVTPLNLDDFDKNDNLIIEQMLEPILMSDEKLIHQGTVILRRIE